MNVARIGRRFMAAASATRNTGVWPLRWPGSDGRASTVTAATFNVLADQFAHGGFHSHLEPSLLGWEHRLPLIIEQIEALQADVLALQEVERPFFERELLPHMRALGYDGWLQTRRSQPSPRLGVGGVAPEEGVALLVRRGRLRADLVQRVRLADLLPPSSRGRFWERVAGQEDVAVIALLRDPRTDRAFVVAATHLHWDPRWPDVKLAQAHLLCSAVGSFIDGRLAPGLPGLPPAQRRRVPALVLGDLNSLPLKTASDAYDAVPPGHSLVSGVYQLLTTGALPPSHQDHPASRRRPGGWGAAAWAPSAAGLQLASAAVAAWGREPAATNSTASFRGCLDYVLMSGHWEVADALPLPHGAMGGAADLLPPLPSAEHPSDHIPLAFRLCLLPEKGGC